MPAMPPWVAATTIKALISGYFVLAAAWDLSIERGRVPNWLTIPPLLIIGGMRLHQLRWEILLFWASMFLLWRLHLFGGGDAKLLMLQGALFPTRGFVLLTGVCWLSVAGGLVVARAYRDGGWIGIATLGRQLGRRFITLRLVPSEEEFGTKAEPATFLFCVSPILYAWLLW